MQLNKIISLSLICSIALFGMDSLENVLSENRNQSFDMTSKKIDEDSQKLQKDWIEPVKISYSYTMDKLATTKEENYSQASIVISQPIFKSGGIEYAIKFADASKKYSNLDLAIAKKTMIKDAVKILFQLKQIDLNIQKQRLMVANAELDIDTKREQVIHGVMDASFLDNAIIDANLKKTALVDLETSKKELENKFKNYSDKDYLTLSLPILSMTSEENFMQNNDYIQKNKDESDKKLWTSKMVATKYLPSINANYTYTHTFNHDNMNDAYYGLSVSLPLDIKYSNDIQSYKIDYMKSKIDGSIVEVEEKNLYKTKIAKLKNIDSKIELAKKDIELYSSLFFQVKELASVGLKTSTDAKILENSLHIKSMDEGILNIDKQIELLELYARYSA